MVAAGDALNVLRRRVRDPNATALSDADGLTLLTWVQRYLNALFAYATATGTVSVPEGVMFIPVANIASNVARPLHVSVEGRQLIRIPWQMLHQTASEHFGSVAHAFPTVWAPYGHTFFAIAPLVQRPLVLTVTYVTIPATIANTATALIIPYHHLTMLYDLGEALLYLRLRQLAFVREPLQRFLAYAQNALGVNAQTAKADVPPTGNP